MAKDKKELDDDLLTGGKTLSSDADNKKAEKKKQAAAKKAEKNAAKLAAKKEKLLKEIEAAKAAVAAESDTEKKEKEQQKLKALQSQLAALGSKKAALQMAKRTKKIATSVIAVVVVVALLVTYVATGAVRKGFISYLGWPAQTVTALTVTDGKDQKANIKVSTYNYYFATTYNNMQSQQSQYQKYGLDLSKYHGLNETIVIANPNAPTTLLQPVAAIEEVTGMAQDSGRSLEEISSLAEDSSGRAAAIATAATEQSAASEEINQNIAEVNQLSAAIATAMESASNQVRDMADQAYVLRDILNNIRSQDVEKDGEDAAA